MSEISPTFSRRSADPGSMASGDLEYLEAVFHRSRTTKRFERSFTLVRGAGHRQRTVGENTNRESVGSKSIEAEPPGM
jgi:hypothetical protein